MSFKNITFNVNADFFSVNLVQNGKKIFFLYLVILEDSSQTMAPDEFNLICNSV